MIWVAESGILLVVALLLRRLLHMGSKSPAPKPYAGRYAPSREPVFKPIAAEIEMQGTMLGVMLNDAFEESKTGHPALADEMIKLSQGQWTRFAELIVDLQDLALRYFPMVQLPVPVRNLNAQAFRSRPMVEYVRFHGLLDQFVFRSKMRFQSHLRLLGQAASVLSEEFHRVGGKAGASSEWSRQSLEHLDLYFHDLDMIAKEILLGFRAELACLPESCMDEISLEIEALIHTGTREPVVLVTQ